MERIKRDQDCFTAVLPKLNKVFVKYIVPELLTRNLQSFGTNSLVPPQDNKKETYCTCKQGEFGPMFACDAKDCPKTVLSCGFILLALDLLKNSMVIGTVMIASQKMY